jgi:FkbM family methyltransferase
LARKSGILGFLERTSIYSAGNDESKFAKVVLSDIHPGDIVWDVGASIGWYTTPFSDAVGDSGMVVAFEPYPTAFESLTKSISSRKNVQLENAALGDFDGEADLYVSRAEGGDYNLFQLGVGQNNLRSKSKVQVAVMKGDTYRAAKPHLAPNKIKIDVEGFEYEVLRGFAETLKSTPHLSLFIEMHFTCMRERGLPDAPAKIVSLLKDNRFQTKWVGPCYMVASK